MRAVAVLLAALIPAVAGATLPVRDDFERATLGANWSGVSIGECGDCTIAPFGDLSGDTAASDAVCFWNADTPASVSYACVRFSLTAAQLGFSGPCLAMDGLNALCCETVGNMGWQMMLYSAGAAVGIQDSASTPVFVPGDYMGIERTAPNLYRCFRSTNGLAWLALGSTDTFVQGSPPGLPDPGAFGAMNNGVGFNIEQWEGGNGTLPVSVPCGQVAPTTTTTTTVTTTSGTAPTTTTTSTTSSSTTSTSLPPPPGPPTGIANGVDTCLQVRFSWTNTTDPFLKQVCIGPQGCANLATAACATAVPGTTQILTMPQTPATSIPYLGCSIDVFGQHSAEVSFGTIQTPPCPVSGCGDVNGDGLVNSLDALAINQYVTGLKSCSQAMAIPGHCDVTHDNKCDPNDVAAINACVAHTGTCTFTCGTFACPTTTTTLPHFLKPHGKDSTLDIRDRHLGTIWYQEDRIRSGPVHFDELEKYGSGPGTWVFCQDCLKTCPATLDPNQNPAGAHCFRDATQWCCNLASGGATPCGQTCPPGGIVTGFDPGCGVICTSCDLTCHNGGTCVFCTEPGGQCCMCPVGFCGMLCDVPCPTTTTTTSTTTITTTTTTETTTTGTGPTTTSTTTTTTSTTSTTAFPQSVTFTWVPSFATQINLLGSSGGTNPDELRCNAYVPQIGIANATTISWEVVNTGAGPPDCGIAIYTADGSSRVVTTGGTSCATGDHTVPSTSFTLDAGTMYQVCICSAGATDYTTASGGSGSGLTKIQNVFSATPMNTIATNTCSSGSPPLTTGTLNVDSAGHGPIVLLLGTNSP